MWDVSRYMKILKQRFTQWYNGRHNRRGTLWEDRFRSVLVEGAGAALKTMTAYIDLNPVRAKICDDPKDYRWSSYGEAVAGGKLAQTALQWLHSFQIESLGTTSTTPNISAQESLERWRCYLFGVPYSKAARKEELSKEKEGGEAELFRSRVSREKSLEVLHSEGRLKRSDYLRCRVRYLSDGIALGSKEFVEAAFQSGRELFAEQRKTGARPLKGLEVLPKPERLYNLRQLQKNVAT